jgi:hypothetical protein
VLGGYEFVGSLTAEERFTRTWAETLQFVRTSLNCSKHPIAEKGRVASNIVKCGIRVVVVLDLSDWA